MDYLLDTHSFLWFINGDAALSLKAKKGIEDKKFIKFISVASFWEIAIKLSIGKLLLDIPFTDLKRYAEINGFKILPLTFEHTLLLANLNFFTRILLTD